MVALRTPTLHEIQEKIQLATIIKIEKTEIDSDQFIFYKTIEDRKKVQKITSFVCDIDENEWEALSGQSMTVSDKNSTNYRLEFLDEKNRTIAILETSSPQPMKLKYKIHTYELSIKNNEVLRNIIEQIEI